GFSATGNAVVTVGSADPNAGVMIYNAGSNYPGSGGSFGAITLAGNASVNLRPDRSGGSAYPGMVLFQARDNARTITLSGGALAGVGGGTIYAPSAHLDVSGNAHTDVKATLVVAALSVSGNGGAFQLDGGAVNDFE